MAIFHDALSGYVTPIAAKYNSMSKLTGLHTSFCKKSIYGANIGLHALTFARSLGRCLKPRPTDLVVKDGHSISHL